MIANSINNSFQEKIIQDFVERTKTKVVEVIPRSITVTQSELGGKTTIEAAPTSEQAGVYRELARKIVEHEVSHVPAPLEQAELRSWASSWADQLIAQETGEVRGVRANI